MVQPLPRPKLGDRALDGDCIFTLRSASTNTSCHDAPARAASICSLRSRGGQLCNQMCSNLKRRASRYTRFLCASRFVHLLRRVEPVFSVLRHTTFNEFLYIYEYTLYNTRNYIVGCCISASQRVQRCAAARNLAYSRATKARDGRRIESSNILYIQQIAPHSIHTRRTCFTRSDNK